MGEGDLMSHEVRLERDSSVTDIYVGEIEDLHEQRDTLRGSARISCYRELNRKNSDSYLIRFFLSLGLIDEIYRKRLWEYKTRNSNEVIVGKDQNTLNYQTSLKIRALEGGHYLKDCYIQLAFGHLERKINLLCKPLNFAN